MTGNTSSEQPARPSAYAAAGVDIDAAAGALERVRRKIQATFPGTGAAAPIGHFGGLFRLPGGDGRLLVASADGVGTKIKLAFALGGDAHARVGGDLVNHCVNDILACGATPRFFLDYVAMGRFDAETFEDLVGGMADACRASGVAMIGGESAEMPGLYADGEYDAAGFIVGDVAEAGVVDGRAVEAGDAVIGLPSGGLQTNGFSLARQLVGLKGECEADRTILARPLPGGGGESIGEALMAPHRSFAPALRPLIGAGIVHGMAHITGGGLRDNLPRMLPDGLGAEIAPGSWDVPAVFDHLAEVGQLSAEERYRTFNMGIGFVVVVDPGDAPAVLSALASSAVIGEIVPTPAGGERVIGLV